MVLRCKTYFMRKAHKKKHAEGVPFAHRVRYPRKLAFDKEGGQAHRSAA